MARKVAKCIISALRCMLAGTTIFCTWKHRTRRTRKPWMNTNSSVFFILQQGKSRLLRSLSGIDEHQPLDMVLWIILMLS